MNNQHGYNNSPYQYTGNNNFQQYQNNGWQYPPTYGMGSGNYNNFWYDPRMHYEDPVEKEKLRKKKMEGFLAGNLTGLMVVGFMFVSFALSFILVALYRDILTNEIAYWAANVLLAVPALVIPFWLLSIYAKKTDTKFNAFPSQKTKPSVFLLATAIGVCVTYLGQYLSSYMQTFFEAIGIHYEYSGSALPSSPFAIVLYVISVVIVPPLCEEFAVRGVLLSYLRRFGDGFAIIVSAMVFAILHMNMVQAPFAFVMGIYAAYITIYTGNIWIAVTVHFIVNGASTLYQILSMYLAEEPLSIAFGLYVLAAIGVGIVCFIIMKCLYSGFCRLKRTDELVKRSHARGFFFLAPVLIVSILYFLISSFFGV